MREREKAGESVELAAIAVCQRIALRPIAVDLES